MNYTEEDIDNNEDCRYTTNLAFTAFQIFCENMDVKYIYPTMFKPVYMVLTHVTIDGKPFEYTQDTIESFRKAIIFVFFDESEESIEYTGWDNKEWFENLPVDYEQWIPPVNDHILRNALHLKLNL